MALTALKPLVIIIEAKFIFRLQSRYGCLILYRENQGGFYLGRYFTSFGPASCLSAGFVQSSFCLTTAGNPKSGIR